tara:strand:- start:479 stop:1393 length:915 start_codon:yes stop_codon:yes gene_type:complete
MNPSNQVSLFGLKNFFNEFIRLYKSDILPNKILLSGPKGIGKCTLSYHLINYIFSVQEQFSYNLEKNLINPENRSFKLIQNNSHPNFILIDINPEKKNIEISQIRTMIEKLNKSSFNDQPRFILIDNIQYMNLNSINALLKILEEPNLNVYFILINNNRKILPTLKSRCINFKIILSNNEISDICKKLFKNDISDIINKDLLDYYFTPGKVFNLIQFASENSIDIKNISLDELLYLIISKNYYKKDLLIKDFLMDYFQLFLINSKKFRNIDLYDYFVKQYSNVKRFNLDEETFFIEFKQKLLNV